MVFRAEGDELPFLAAPCPTTLVCVLIPLLSPFRAVGTGSGRQIFADSEAPVLQLSASSRDFLHAFRGRLHLSFPPSITAEIHHGLLGFYLPLPLFAVLSDLHLFFLF